MSKPKLKSTTPDAAAARQSREQQRTVEALGAVIDLPEVQRDAARFRLEDTGMGAGPRTTSKTLRRLTQVEKLARSGCLDKVQAEAIGLYVDAAEQGYAGCVQATVYGSASSASATASAVAAHGRQLARIGSADRYHRGRAVIAAADLPMFERVVLDNHPLGTVAREAWPMLGRSQVSHRLRELLKLCGDKLAIEFGLVETRRTSLLKTMQRMDAVVKQERAATPLTKAIWKRLDRATASDRLLVSPAVAADLMRECEWSEIPSEFGALPLIVVEHWQAGWMVQGGAEG